MQDLPESNGLLNSHSARSRGEAGGKTRRSVGLLLQDIARCRAEIARRETVISDLQRRLLAEAGPWEEKLLAIRIEIFRILGKHLKSGRLNRKACKSLELALYDLAEELETVFGADLRRDRLWIFEEEIPPYGRDPERGRSPDDGDPGEEADHLNGDPPGSAGAGAYRESDFPPRGSSGRKNDWDAPGGQAVAGDIRALYLLLARALHPDKEPDPARLEAKTVWMQKVTAAYADRNLAALLDILAANPLDSVGPYLSQAPAKTVQGFAKRLRRELEILLARLAVLDGGAGADPFLAGFLKRGELNEIAYNTYLARARKELNFMRQRRDAYRTTAGVDGLVEALRSHDWRELL